jgi:hypothetical protein
VKIGPRIGISSLLLAPLALVAHCRQPQDKSNPSAQEKNPAELVREVIENEIKAEENDHSLWEFRMDKWEDGKNKTYVACQATEGPVYRLVAINGRELSQRDKESEKHRVAKFAKDPGEVRERQKKITEDAKDERKLMAAIPRAFVFLREGSKGDRVRLHFKPNPKFHASNHIEMVLHHLEGTITVDARQKRLADIRGTLGSTVKFGGGLFGHLDKGGTFWVSQDDLGSGIWELADLDVRMNGKALLFFKTISVRQRLIYRKYRRVPENTTIEQAVAKVLSDDSQYAATAR